MSANVDGPEGLGAVTADELRLITCTGCFDPDSGHYDRNLIVFAGLATVY